MCPSDVSNSENHKKSPAKSGRYDQSGGRGRTSTSVDFAAEFQSWTHPETPSVSKTTRAMCPTLFAVLGTLFVAYIAGLCWLAMANGGAR